MFTYDYVVFIGRMQGPHKAHLEIIREALKYGQNAIILVGSANSPRTCKNPWTVQERETMIRSCLSPSENGRTYIFGIEDRLYNDPLWIQQIQRVVHQVTGLNKKVALIGCHKDDSSYYLDVFPQWKLIDVEEFNNVNSTDIRNVYFNENTRNGYQDIELFSLMEEPVRQYLLDFMKTDHYAYLCNEYDFLVSHKEKWSKSPYPVSFNCADAFVLCSGHILLIKRRNAPGKDLYALPGGYIGMSEQPVDAALRELIEETKIKGPTFTQLKKSIVAEHVFSHPARSLRGRIYSHAYAINLGAGPLPKVKGSDDAIKAKWFTIDEVDNMRHLLFEDHADIIAHFKGLIGNG